MSLQGRWRDVLLGAAGSAGFMLLGALVARAAPGMVLPGVGGGASRGALSFAGVLKGAPGRGPLTFVFKKGGQVQCQGTTAEVENGEIAVEVPLDGCKESLFDGSEVTVDIKVGSQQVTDQPISITPVPQAKYADKVGTPDCPVGYEKDGTEVRFVVCQKKRPDGQPYDEMVRVGRDATAFWIDRYEATVWSDEGPRGWVVLDSNPATFGPDRFPRNGQYSRDKAGGNPPFFALSVQGQDHLGGWTWFQADYACRNSGKRLPTGSEWLAAARSTPDPGEADGNDGTCVTKRPDHPLTTGGRKRCASLWGAEDMIGNVWEWTDEWYAGVGDTSSPLQGQVPWPNAATEYGNDGTYNIASKAVPAAGAPPAAGMPAAAIRGGSWDQAAYGASGAGVFTLNLQAGPSAWSGHNGFRCVIPR